MYQSRAYMVILTDILWLKERNRLLKENHFWLLVLTDKQHVQGELLTSTSTTTQVSAATQTSSKKFKN